jgi:sensor histidine kinase YesM
MLKSKQSLYFIKKTVFQLFYFLFIAIVYFELVNSKFETLSVFDKWVLVGQMLVSCLFVFIVNVQFFDRALFVEKNITKVLLKNAVMISAILGCLFYIDQYLAINQTTDPQVLFFYHLLFLLFTLAAALYYLDFINYLQNKSAIFRLIKEKNKFEVDLLKSQFTPHFLFNTLNSIYSKCHTSSPEAANMIFDLSNFMRYLIYDCSTHRVLINKEVTLIQNFIKLYKLNYNAQINIDFKHKLYDENQRIAPMLLLNFVENAFKHSQIGVSNEAYVVIELATDQDYLYFKTKNNKTSFQNKLEKGIGNQNTINRLELDYKDQYTFEVTDLKESYEVYLNIRL